MGNFKTRGNLKARAASRKRGPRPGLALALVWLLGGCASVLPIVADKVAQITEMVMAKEEADPGGHDLRARAGQATAEGRYTEAVAYLDAALSVDAYDDRALAQLAVIYRLTGRPGKAERYENMAREIDLVDTGIWTPPAVEVPIPEDAHIIQRFAALDRILETGLITPVEYDARREANLGALLPLTQPEPVITAGRRPPLARDVIERLRAIARFNDSGDLNDSAYAAERNAILDGLMPLPADGSQAAVVTPEALDPETHQRDIDRLLAGKLISRREYNKESAVLIGLYSPAAGTMDDADSAPVGQLSMKDKPFTAEINDAMVTDLPIVHEEAGEDPLDAAETEPGGGQLTASRAGGRAPYDEIPGDEILGDEIPALEPVAESVTRINIHLALSRTPDAAKRSWDDLQQANGLALDGLIPQVSRVDLGDGKGVFFQLSAGPLADMATAQALCDELLSRDFYCAPLVF